MIAADRLSSPSYLKIWGWFSWTILGLILLWSWALRLQDPTYPLADPDSWGWLVPALRWLSGLGFHQHYEREWLYGAFLAACLKSTGSFTGIIFAQNALGILSGIFLFATWRTWTALFPQNLLWQVPATLIGLILTADQMAEGNYRVLESWIRPEAIMGVVGFGQLLCISLYCKATWFEKNARKAIVFGALAVPLAWALYILKPNWALAVPATLFPLAVGILWSPLSWAARLIAPAAGCLLILVLLVLPEKMLFIPSSEPSTVLPLTLLTIHADVIRESYAQRINDPSDPRQKLLAEFMPDFDREMAEARKITRYYGRLGFDPDYLMYRSSLPIILMNRYGMSKQELNAFCKESYIQAWRTNPDLMLRKIWNQSTYFLLPVLVTFTRKKQAMDRYVKDTADLIPETMDQNFSPEVEIMYQDWRFAISTLAEKDVKPMRPAQWVFDIRKEFAPAAPWVTGAFAMAFLACLVWPSLFHLRVPGLLTLTFWGASAGNALTVAIVHALDNSRYRFSYGSLYFFALGAMAVFVLYVLAASLWPALQKLKKRKAELCPN